MIRASVPGATSSGLLSALQTVIGATPDNRAIDFMSGATLSFLRFRVGIAASSFLDDRRVVNGSS
jgi:hypothetical protein